MPTSNQNPDPKNKQVKARPRPEIDRNQLRADIAARYENTLKYLGR
jgi:hypothetical protein